MKYYKFVFGLLFININFASASPFLYLWKITNNSKSPVSISVPCNNSYKLYEVGANSDSTLSDWWECLIAEEPTNVQFIINYSSATPSSVAINASITMKKFAPYEVSPLIYMKLWNPTTQDWYNGKYLNPGLYVAYPNTTWINLIISDNGEIDYNVI